MTKLEEKLKLLLETRTKEWRTRNYPWALGVLCIMAIVSLVAVIQTHQVEGKQVPIENKTAWNNVPLTAKAALVWDVTDNKELFSKNADRPMPLASLTKVMTVLTAEDRSINSRQEKVTVTPDDVQTEGDSILRIGSIWNLKTLIDYSLLASSNDGATAIASAFGSKEQFITQMNLEATKIGLTNARFKNEHGLDISPNQAGSLGSARDMTILFQYILKNYPTLLEATKYDSLPFRDEEGDVYNANNTNVAANLIPNLIASKTGFTDLAGGNLVVMFDAGVNHPIIISVLGSTEEARFTDVLQLASSTLKYLNDN